MNPSSMLLPVDPRLRRLLWLILGVGLGLRLLAACGLQYLLETHWHRDFLIPGDAEGYWELGQRIARGEDFSIYSPPRFVLRMPGFPAILALSIRLFGESLFAARLVLALLGASACWLAFLLGRQAFGEKVGVIAAALTAICPVFVMFSVIVLSETSFAVTLLLGLMAGQRLYDLLQRRAGPGPVILQAALTGIAIAAGCYMRPSWIMAAPIFAVLLTLFSPRRLAGAAAGGLVIGSMVLALLPWGIRNQRVTGHFKLTTFWMGPSLYDGLNPEATGDSDMRFFDREGLGRQMSEFDVDQHYKQRAIDFARENPRRTAELAVVKLWRYLKPWPNASEFGSLWISLLVGGFYIPMLCLAGCAIWSGRAGIWSIAVFAGPILYFAALHLFFVSSLRYRLPAEYPLLILSAAGLKWLCSPTRPGTGTRL
ncbi:ArnT family glycosyltransferase [Planctomicrobium sp. SH664]|uniref:ArnT family glycosyltransferase n=1 Tax=Planctomicrobium sp. SH664 TaxID=3448125 RepID=UPI003F5AF0D3